MTDLLELEVRRKIFNLIKEDPGLYSRKIALLLKLNGQLVDYHLAYMERHGLISSVKEEGYRRYFIKGKTGRLDIKRISILRQEKPLIIVLFLLQNPFSTHKQILDKIGMTPSTLSYHLGKLKKANIIAEKFYDSTKLYKVINEKEIIKLLIQYKPYSRIESFKDTWIDLKWPGI